MCILASVYVHTRELEQVCSAQQLCACLCFGKFQGQHVRPAKPHSKHPHTERRFHCTNTRVHTHTHTHKHTQAHTHTHTYKHTHEHTSTHIIHTQAHTSYTHTHTHTHTHTRTHTSTHTHLASSTSRNPVRVGVLFSGASSPRSTRSQTPCTTLTGNASITARVIACLTATPARKFMCVCMCVCVVCVSVCVCECVCACMCVCI